MAGPHRNDLNPTVLYHKLDKIIPSIFILFKFNYCYLYLRLVPLKEKIRSLIHTFVYFMIAIDFTFALSSNI